MDFQLYLTYIFFIVVSFVNVATSTIQITRIQYQKIFKNKKMPPSFEDLSYTNASWSQCAVHCNNRTDCFAYGFHTANKQCDLSKLYPPLIQMLETSLPVDVGTDVYYTEKNEYSCNVSYTVGLATDVVQNLSSPNHPGFYSHNLDEFWLIIKPKSSTLVLNFHTMDVEDIGDCAFDRVVLFEGYCTLDQEIARFCGSETRYFEISDGLYIVVYFHTDHNNAYGANHSGFTFAYKII